MIEEGERNFRFEPGSPSGRPGQAGRGNWLEYSILAGLFALVWLFWNTWLVYPLKLLVVFFHELSHGLAALATGGSIERIEMVAQEGGVCVTRGGTRFWVLTAGYLGSLVWGGSILVVASRTRLDKMVQTVLGLTLLVAAGVWVRPLLSFGFGFALLAGLGLTAAGLLLPGPVNDLLLKLIGLTSMLYAVLDIGNDILARPHLLESDAAQLARETGIPTLFWGGLWLLVALAGGVFFLSWARPGRSREPSDPAEIE